MIETLSLQEILKIHDALVADFAASGDPIGNMGLRSQALLESAIGRQFSGHGATLKYSDAVGNAATLCFGICCDHPFVNGNKRTALVSMLVHLDKNRLCLHQTRESDLFELMLALADHLLRSKGDRRTRTLDHRFSADEQVSALKEWLSDRTVRVRRGERVVTVRHLRQILSRFSIELEPIGGGNRAEFIKVERRRRFFGGEYEVRTRLGLIGCKNEGAEVALRDLKNLRRRCKLTEEDGVDSDAFYGDAASIDVFVNRYRTLLRRLAKT
jgi:death-on-curing protein